MYIYIHTHTYIVYDYLIIHNSNLITNTLFPSLINYKCVFFFNFVLFHEFSFLIFSSWSDFTNTPIGFRLKYIHLHYNLYINPCHMVWYGMPKYDHVSKSISPSFLSAHRWIFYA